MGPWKGQVAPLAGELLSSWVIRLAQLSGNTPFACLKMALGVHSWWCRDFDLLCGPEQFEKLTSFSGIPVDIIASHSFQEWRSSRHLGITPGLLASGIYHRQRLKCGLQYCPQCMLETEQRFYRREWRFALQIGCPRHWVMLRDSCPHCEQPLMPYRRYDGQIGRCSECNGPLGCAPAPLTARQIDTCSKMHQAFSSQKVTVGEMAVSLSEFITTFRVLHGFLISPRIPIQMADQLLNGSQPASGCETAFRVLETTSIHDRGTTIPACLSLYDNWPTGLLKMCADHGVTRTQLADGRLSNLPPWFSEALAKLNWPTRNRRRKRRMTGRKRRVAYRIAFQQIDLTNRLEQVVQNRFEPAQ